MNKLLALMILEMLGTGNSLSSGMDLTPLESCDANPFSRFRVTRISEKNLNEVQKEQTHEEMRKDLLSLCEGYHLLKQEPALGAAILGEWRMLQQVPAKRLGLFFRVNTDFLNQGTVAFEIRNNTPNGDFLVLSYATHDYPMSMAARCIPQMYDIFKVLQKYAEQDSNDASNAAYPALFYITRISSIPKIYIRERDVCSQYSKELLRTSLQGRCFSYSFGREFPGELALLWLNENQTLITKEFLEKQGMQEAAKNLPTIEISSRYP